MIDLSRNRAGLLAEIEAPEPAGDPLSDLTDPRVTTEGAHVHVCGRAREDLFPLLEIALSERFAAVPRQELIRNLLMPLKSALGNACKHGNRDDPAKAVFVELVLTPNGALIAVTDEGAGFDAALTFRRFQKRESFFVNRGSGFRNLHRAASTVSYENGGRTLLLCFRPSTSGNLRSDDRACPAPTLAELANNHARIESCRVYPAWGCGNRYVLRIARRTGQAAETRILTGRLHTSEAAAKADFEAAASLRDARISRSVLIPRPVVIPVEEPRLVLCDFDPWMNLWEYLGYWCSLEALRNSTERIGRALARLHRSQVAFNWAQTHRVGEGRDAMAARAERRLQALRCGHDLVNRFRVSVRRILDRHGFGGQRTAPIHGALGWDCIHYGIDGFFYLYRFETCRRSDPGLDLGGFASDLLRFTLVDLDEGAYRTCRDALLASYNQRAEHAMNEDELRFYIALALVERLQRAGSRTRADTEELLNALEAASCGWGEP